MWMDDQGDRSKREEQQEFTIEQKPTLPSYSLSRSLFVSGSTERLRKIDNNENALLTHRFTPLFIFLPPLRGCLLFLLLSSPPSCSCAFISDHFFHFSSRCTSSIRSSFWGQCSPSLPFLPSLSCLPSRWPLLNRLACSKAIRPMATDPPEVQVLLFVQKELFPWSV